MTAERLRSLAASPWADVTIGVAVTLATWAEWLGQPRRPVKTYVARVLMKLDLPDRVHAVIFAYETGLIQAGEA